MRAAGYYAIAVALFAATIPMYRYIFQRPTEARFSEPVHPVYQATTPESLRLALAQPEARLLMPGEICEAGVVVLVSGSTYTQAVGPDRRSVACSGRYIVR